MLLPNEEKVTIKILDIKISFLAQFYENILACFC